MKQFHPNLCIYAIYIADIYNMFQGRDTSDISHHLQFSLMQPVLYFDEFCKDLANIKTKENDDVNDHTINSLL